MACYLALLRVFEVACRGCGACRTKTSSTAMKILKMVTSLLQSPWLLLLHPPEAAPAQVPVRLRGQSGSSKDRPRFLDSAYCRNPSVPRCLHPVVGSWQRTATAHEGFLQRPRFEGSGSLDSPQGIV